MKANQEQQDAPRMRNELHSMNAEEKYAPAVNHLERHSRAKKVQEGSGRNSDIIRQRDTGRGVTKTARRYSAKTEEREAAEKQAKEKQDQEIRDLPIRDNQDGFQAYSAGMELRSPITVTGDASFSPVSQAASESSYSVVSSSEDVDAFFNDIPSRTTQDKGKVASSGDEYEPNLPEFHDWGSLESDEERGSESRRDEADDHNDDDADDPQQHTCTDHMAYRGVPSGNSPAADMDGSYHLRSHTSPKLSPSGDRLNSGAYASRVQIPQPSKNMSRSGIVLTPEQEEHEFEQIHSSSQEQTDDMPAEPQVAVDQRGSEARGNTSEGSDCDEAESLGVKERAQRMTPQPSPTQTMPSQPQIFPEGEHNKSVVIEEHSAPSGHSKHTSQGWRRSLSPSSPRGAEAQDHDEP